MKQSERHLKIHSPDKQIILVSLSPWGIYCENSFLPYLGTVCPFSLSHPHPGIVTVCPVVASLEALTSNPGLYLTQVRAHPVRTAFSLGAFCENNWWQLFNLHLPEMVLNCWR